MPSAHDAAMMQGRQRPGAACEDCRRRKLKCDGGRPKCSNCADSGVECTINPQRTARGPKKGYIKALRNRVGMQSYTYENLALTKANICPRSSPGKSAGRATVPNTT